MRNNIFLILISSLIFLFSCDDDGLGDGKWGAVITNNPGDEVDFGVVVGGLFNGDMEINNQIETNLPSGWNDRVAGFVSPNNYDFFHTDTFAIDSLSARINGYDIDNQNEYGYLLQRIEAPNIPPAALVRIRGKVKTDDLFGNGFNMMIYGFGVNGNLIFGVETVNETRFVRGDTDWTEYTSSIASFPAGLDQIEVRLAIGPNTTGDVYFDDIVIEID